MRMQNTLLTFMLTGLLLPFAASALIIDDFSTDQAELSVSPLVTNTDSSTVTGAGIIGGERDMFLSIAAGTSPLSSQARVDFDRFTLSNSAESSSLVTMQWDGIDGDASNINTTGLGTMDLTDGNVSNAFEIRFLFNDLPSTLDLTVWSASGSSTVTFPSPALLLTGSLSLFIPFDAFTGSADFTAIGAIQLEIASPTNGNDLSIDYIQTVLEPVPVPPALLLFASSLLGLALRRRS